MSEASTEDGRLTVRGLLEESLMSQARVIAGDDRLDDAAELGAATRRGPFATRSARRGGRLRPSGGVDRERGGAVGVERKRCHHSVGGRRGSRRLPPIRATAEPGRHRDGLSGRLRGGESVAGRTLAQPGSARDALFDACARVAGRPVPPRARDCRSSSGRCPTWRATRRWCSTPGRTSWPTTG